jgi:hypothetical protein
VGLSVQVDGSTPLYIARLNGHTRVVAVLEGWPAERELRRRASALGLLQALTDVNVADANMLKEAIAWCDKQGVTSASDMVKYDMVDDFISHLGLKTLPGRKLRSILQAPTTALAAQISNHPVSARRFDVFISHCTTDDSHDVFKVVSAFLHAKGKVVFNPTTHLSHVQKINAAAMADAVKRSQLVVAALSEGFFGSKWCEAEIAAAKEAGIKVVPAFSGDDHGSKQIDKWVARYRDHAAFGYIFRENARDVLNKQNDAQVSRTLEHLSTLC